MSCIHVKRYAIMVLHENAFLSLNGWVWLSASDRQGLQPLAVLLLDYSVVVRQAEFTRLKCVGRLRKPTTLQSSRVSHAALLRSCGPALFGNRVRRGLWFRAFCERLLRCAHSTAQRTRAHLSSKKKLVRVSRKTYVKQESVTHPQTRYRLTL